MANTLKERKKKIDFAPFPFELTAIVSSDPEQSVLNRAEKFNLEAPTEDMGACIYNLGDGRCFMFMPDDARLDYVVHESSHVIWVMLERSGVKLDTEVVAYYTGYLSMVINDFVCNPPKPRLRRPRRKKSDKLSRTR